MSKQSRRKSKRHRKPQAKQTSHQSYWYRQPLGDDYEARLRVVSNTAAKPQRTKEAWEAFAARVQEKAGLDELGLAARHLDLPNAQDVRIYDADNHRVAIVSDEGASVEGHGGVSGDFLGDGNHWDRLHTLLVDQTGASAETYEFHPISDEQMTAAMPASAVPKTVERAKQASRVIWERFHALAHPIELPGKQFSIVFWPATQHNKVTGLPFEYKPHGGAAISARLCLLQRRDREILPVAASSSIASDELWPVWAIALCEFAHFVELAETQRGKGAGVSSDEPGERHLRAVSSAFVGAFVRRLPEGQHASPDAKANAEVRGVVLKGGETLVTEHVRHGTENRFVRIDGWTSSVSLHEIGGQQQRAA
jgi:hypothetical protein